MGRFQASLSHRRASLSVLFFCISSSIRIDPCCVLCRRIRNTGAEYIHQVSNSKSFPLELPYLIHSVSSSIYIQNWVQGRFARATSVTALFYGPSIAIRFMTPLHVYLAFYSICLFMWSVSQCVFVALDFPDSIQNLGCYTEIARTETIWERQWGAQS